MRKFIKNIFVDEYGGIKFFWEITGFVIAVLVGAFALVAIIVAIAWPIQELGCSQKGDQYSVESDFKFWAAECFYALDDGTVVSDDKFQAIGVKEGWIE